MPWFRAQRMSKQPRTTAGEERWLAQLENASGQRVLCDSAKSLRNQVSPLGSVSEFGLRKVCRMPPLHAGPGAPLWLLLVHLEAKADRILMHLPE